MNDVTANSVITENTYQDYLGLSRAAWKGQRGAYLIYIVGAAAICVFLAITLISLLERKHVIPRDGIFNFIPFVIIFYVSYLFILKMLRPQFAKLTFKEGQVLQRRTKVLINETGIQTLSDVGESTYLWQGVDRMVKTKEHLFVFIDRRQGFIIPLRSFSHSDAAEAFCKNANSLWNATKDKPVTPRI